MKYRIWHKHILDDGRIYEYPTKDIYDTYTEAMAKCPEKYQPTKWETVEYIVKEDNYEYEKKYWVVKAQIWSTPEIQVYDTYPRVDRNETYTDTVYHREADGGPETYTRVNQEQANISLPCTFKDLLLEKLELEKPKQITIKYSLNIDD